MVLLALAVISASYFLKCNNCFDDFGKITWCYGNEEYRFLSWWSAQCLLCFPYLRNRLSFISGRMWDDFWQRSVWNYQIYPWSLVKAYHWVRWSGLFLFKMKPRRYLTVGGNISWVSLSPSLAFQWEFLGSFFEKLRS